MSTLGLYCVHDMKAAQYLPPFTSMNDATAKRQFASAVVDEGHEFSRHAEDYSLWKVGTFDGDNARIKGKKQMIINAFDLKNQLNMPEDWDQPVPAIQGGQ